GRPGIVEHPACQPRGDASPGILKRYFGMRQHPVAVRIILVEGQREILAPLDGKFVAVAFAIMDNLGHRTSTDSGMAAARKDRSFRAQRVRLVPARRTCPN